MRPPIWMEVVGWEETANGRQLDASPKDGYAGRLEVIEGLSGRRWSSQVEQAPIAAESFVPGMRFADAARKHGSTRWQICD